MIVGTAPSRRTSYTVISPEPTASYGPLSRTVRRNILDGRFDPDAPEERSIRASGRPSDVIAASTTIPIILATVLTALGWLATLPLYGRTEPLEIIGTGVAVEAVRLLNPAVSNRSLLIVGFTIGVFPKVVWQVVQTAFRQVTGLVVKGLRTDSPSAPSTASPSGTTPASKRRTSRTSPTWPPPTSSSCSSTPASFPTA